jgi:hypothetical protein
VGNARGREKDQFSDEPFSFFFALLDSKAECRLARLGMGHGGMKAWAGTL